MFKIGSCGLCQKAYRTGGLRQLIQREMVGGDLSKGKRKMLFGEDRIVVCNSCYKRLEKGEGVEKVDMGGSLWDSPEINEVPIKKTKDKSAFHEVTAALASKSKEESDAKLKKERKPRGVRVSTKGSVIAESLASSNFEDEDTDEKSKEKKHRKVKATAKALREKTYHPQEDVAKEVFSAINEVRDDAIAPKIDEETQEPVETIADAVKPVVEEPEQIEVSPVSNSDRKQYKEQVRQALAQGGTIMYSEIARKLNIDEGLVVRLANEIDGEV